MAEKSVKLFLDDVRNPSMVFRGKDALDWVIVRNFHEAVKFCEKNGCPDRIAFDHDLGWGPNGYDFAKYLTEADLDGKIQIPEHFEWSVHSANPVAHPQINGHLRSYLDFKEQEKANLEAAAAVSK